MKCGGYLLRSILAGSFLILLTRAEERAEENVDITINVIWKPENCVREVKSGDFVRYHYYGMLTDGTYFDSSYERGSTYDTYVGTGWLILGMDKGLIGMCLNEQRLISVPSELAYGAEGTEDGIPPNATLLFNFLLLDVWNDNDTIQVETTYLPENCDRKIVASDYVRYHYNGTLLNGKKFHSSYDEEETYNTYVGKGWVIKGMDEGLVGACLGERRTIVVPPHLGYGSKGDDKNIPRSATIIFKIEIIDFHNPEDEVTITITKEVPDCKRKLEDTDFIRYHYNGTLADGTVFDTSYQRNRTYDTYIGYKRVIPGMETGLQGACMGEWRTITFPPHLGYGEKGVEGKIPPSAVLTFHVHVIDFHNPKDEVVVDVIELPEECKSDETKKAEVGDYLTFDYEMRLMDGTLLDTSKSSTGDFGKYLGKRQLIPGVDRGLVGMCVGEVRGLIVPPHVGFGEKGREGSIPGSAVLNFTINLHKIEAPLPDGFQLYWVEDPPESEEELFETIDENEDGFLTLSEFTSFVLDQVERGHARLLPGYPREEVIVDLFKHQDKNDDQQLTPEEFTLRKDDPVLGSRADEEL
uniref:peptidylprolyl isomerase n=1 Tax=Phallusia mammillata TaxID=59560 RepID=A0A6F9DDR6_9ASCI|nr:peptidyl-prolyl cis-trans isomerase FKBP9 [Phallusia mammillata]